MTMPDDPRVLARRAQVVALTRRGLTTAEVAAAVGISTRQVVRHRERAGISRGNPPPYSEEELSTAQALLEAGCSYAEVARTLGRGDGKAIARRFPGYGWTRSEGAELGAFQRWMRYRAPELADAI